MKTKSARILGVVMTLVLVVSMVIGIPMTASAASQQYSAVALPSATGNVLSASDVTGVWKAGSNLFASVVTEAGVYTLRKSTNNGRTWANSGLTLAAGEAPIAVKASANNANRIYVAVSDGAGTSNYVSVSTDGGTTFGLNYAPALAAGANILSMDVGFYGSANVVVVGSGPDASASNVQVLDENPAVPAWANQGNAAWTNVHAVALSNTFATDRMITAVADTGVDTVVSHRFGPGAWAGTIGNATIAGAVPAPIFPAPGASIAMPSDYNSTSNRVLFVGLNNAGALSDVYEIDGVSAPTASVAVDLNAGGTTDAAPEISSLIVSGPAAAATILAGENRAAPATATRVWRSTNSGQTWSSVSRPPSGGEALLGSHTFLVFGADANTVYAGTVGVGGVAPVVIPDGVADDESAFSVSTDGGQTFAARSLIDTSIGSIDQVLPAGSTDLFMVTTSAAFISSLWRSTNPATDGWYRTWLRADPAAAGPVMIVSATKTYDTDKTLWAAVDDTVAATAVNVFYSTNSGASFTQTKSNITTDAAGVAVVGDATAILAVNANVVLVGEVGGDVFRTSNKGTSWLSVNTAAAVPVSSLALAPGSTTTVLAGSTGEVYLSTDGGVTFATLPSAGSTVLAAGAQIADFDPAYATNNRIYSADTATPGLATYTVGTSTDWTVTALPAVNGLAVVAGPAGQDTTLYVSDPTAGTGIQRSISPNATAPVYAAVVGSPVSLPATATAMGIAARKTAAANEVWIIDPVSGPAIRIWTYTDNLAVQTVVGAPTNITQTGANVNWTAMTGATAYQVQSRVKGAGAAFANVLPAPGTTTNTFLAVPALAGQTIEYRVRAATPDLSYWSATAEFTTQLAARPWNPGAVIAMMQPAPASTIATTTPSFQWSGADGATGYELKVSDKADLSTLVINLTGGAALGAGQTAYKVPDDKALKDGQTYYWQVRAAMGTTTYSPWSDVFLFSVALPAKTTPPPPPITIPPATSTTLVVTQPPATTVTVVQPPAPAPTTVTLTVPPAPAPPTPSWVWAIIAIGGVLLIVVIVLIARTRKV